MKITRIFTNENNQSQFEEIELNLSPAEFGKRTVPIETNPILFGEIDEPTEISWHNPTVPQYVIMLKGSIEIETGDGAKRQFNPGDIFFADDLTGQGHLTRSMGDETRHYLIIPVK